jgi:stress-induced-phosphoprotein 1
MSRELAQAAKDRGNAEFTAKNYASAVEHFTEAIRNDPSDHVFYSNRSACYASLEQYPQALADAEKCVELKPDWVRGYTRKGLAEFYLQEYSKAIETYSKGLELEPGNEQLKTGLANAQQKIGERSNPFAQFFTGENLGKLMNHPKTRGFFSQPDFVSLLKLVQQNPQMIQGLMNDQRVMTCMGVLMGIEDFGSAGSGDSPGYTSPPPSPAEAQPTSQPKKAEETKHPSLSLAEEAKLAGNQAYSKRNFVEALGHYDRASELNPEEITYYTNKASVFMEMGEFQQALECCDKAVEIGRSVHTSLEKIARAFERKAHIFEKMSQIDNAIAAAKQAQLEHKTDKVKYYLKDLESLKKKDAESAYIDPQLSEEANTRGNEFFKAGNFPRALAEYDEAIRRNPEPAKLYGNRSAVYLKLMELPRALADVNKCLEIDPGYIKAYGRKGDIHFLMKEFHKSMEAFEQGLKLDPNDAKCKEGFHKTLAEINSSSQGQPDEERMRHAMADPEIQSILRDPQMQNILRDLGEGKSEAQSYMSDPRVSAAISKLVAAGVVKTG